MDGINWYTFVHGGGGGVYMHSWAGVGVGWETCSLGGDSRHQGGLEPIPIMLCVQTKLTFFRSSTRKCPVGKISFFKLIWFLVHIKCYLMSDKRDALNIIRVIFYTCIFFASVKCLGYILVWRRHRSGNVNHCKFLPRASVPWPAPVFSLYAHSSDTCRLLPSCVISKHCWNWRLNRHCSQQLSWGDATAYRNRCELEFFFIWPGDRRSVKTLPQAQEGSFMRFKAHHFPALPGNYWRFETLAFVGRVMEI